MPSLSKQLPGTTAYIAQVHGGDKLNRHLEGLGLVALSQIEVLINQGRGPLAIRVKGTKVALGRSMADKIEVEQTREAALRATVYGDSPEHKQTRQREVIIKVISNLTSHLTADEIVHQVRQHDPSIGPATVYRTIKLLVDKGMLSPRSFDAQNVRYELITTHHDHLVCTRCGTIIEFMSRDIEEHQQEVTDKHSFAPSGHSLTIYGLCAECRKTKIE